MQNFINQIKEEDENLGFFFLSKNVVQDFSRKRDMKNPETTNRRGIDFPSINHDKMFH